MRLVCLLLALVAACRGDRPPATVSVTSKIPLRYHPPAGAEYHYVLEQSSRFGPDTASTADSATVTAMHLAFSQRIGPRAADGFMVTVTLDSSGVRSPMMSPGAAAEAAAQLRGVRVTGVMDDRLRFVRDDFSALARISPIVREEVQLGLRAAALGFPEEPVGPGDSWSVETALPFAQLTSGATLSASTKLTVRSISVTGADTTVRLGLETTLPDRPLEFNFGGQRIVVRLRGGLAGEQVFSLTRGAVVSGALGGDMHLTVTGGLFGTQGMAMRVEQRAATRLVESRGGR